MLTRVCGVWCFVGVAGVGWVGYGGCWHRCGGVGVVWGV